VLDDTTVELCLVLCIRLFVVLVVIIVNLRHLVNQRRYEAAYINYHAKPVCNNNNKNNNNRLTAFVPGYPGRPVPQETLTHSPILIIGQPLTPFSIYNDP